MYSLSKKILLYSPLTCTSVASVSSSEINTIWWIRIYLFLVHFLMPHDRGGDFWARRNKLEQFMESMTTWIQYYLNNLRCTSLEEGKNRIRSTEGILHWSSYSSSLAQDAPMSLSCSCNAATHPSSLMLTKPTLCMNMYFICPSLHLAAQANNYSCIVPRDVATLFIVREHHTSHTSMKNFLILSGRGTSSEGPRIALSKTWCSLRARSTSSIPKELFSCLLVCALHPQSNKPSPL